MTGKMLPVHLDIKVARQAVTAPYAAADDDDAV